MIMAEINRFDDADAEMNRLLIAVTEVGLDILDGARAPMRLWEFSERLAHMVGVRVVPDLRKLSEAIKELLRKANHPRLRVSAASMPDAGYVFDQGNEETWPVVSPKYHSR